MSCFHFSTREWCQTVPAIPCKQNVHLVFSLSKRFVAHRSPLVLHQMCVGMGWRSRHLSVGRTPHTLLPSSMLGLPPACLWECAAAHLWHATIAMPHSEHFTSSLPVMFYCSSLRQKPAIWSVVQVTGLMALTLQLWDSYQKALPLCETYLRYWETSLLLVRTPLARKGGWRSLLTSSQLFS